MPASRSSHISLQWRCRVVMRTAKDMLVFVIISASLVCSEGFTIPNHKVAKYYCNGECNVERTRCSCMSTCKQERKCCTDYVESCGGQSKTDLGGGESWTKEECAKSQNRSCPEGYSTRKPLLLISLDGYRDTYLKRNLTPTVAKIARCGVSAPYMRSQYPTKTLPNHYTMVTGLYAESHGIIANKMYNHDLQEEFSKDKDTKFNPHWWKGEPIWVTARRQGLVTAAYFWPGSDVNIKMYPNYWYKYNDSVDLEERVYQMLDWVDMPEDKRPSLITMYTAVVDLAGHKYGPAASEGLDRALREADNFVEMIMNGLRDRELDNCFNVLVMSDHGMTKVDCGKNVRYVGDNGINMAEVYSDLGPYARIGKSANKSLRDKFDAIKIKKKLECKRDETHWEAFLKKEYLPKRYHYANNPLIEDIHLVSDQGWWIGGDSPNSKCKIGNHGFDNIYEDMRGIFFAHGPDLRREFKRSHPVSNIELYNLYADLLKVKPSPNNGTNGSLYDVMVKSPALDKEAGFSPSSCLYPMNGSNADDLGCDGCNKNSTKEANERLKLTESQLTEIENKHLLYGSPRILDANPNFCKLVQRDYITMYDNQMKLPRLVSFVVKKEQSLQSRSKCVRLDRRLSDDAIKTCTDYNMDDKLTWDFLYPPGLSSDESKWDATLSSNMVPIYKAFVEVWNYMQNYIGSLGSNGVTIDVGPIFDYDYDGHADNLSVKKRNEKASFGAVPTHFFLVMTKCNKFSTDETIENCAGDVSKIEVLSFIIPNYKEAPCHKDNEAPKVWIPRALVRHVATVKDVELLTNISFFSNWVASDDASKEDHISAIQLKLQLPQRSSDWLQQFVPSVSPTGPPTETTTSGAALDNANYLCMLLLSIHVIVSRQ